MKSFDVAEDSQVGSTRRAVTHIAEDAGMAEDECERLALIVTEACTNLVRHAAGGEMLVDVDSAGEAPVVTVIALDDGPGIPNVEAAMVDGYSTAAEQTKGIGGGLGAIQRQADDFDIHSASHGTTLLARVGKPAGRSSRFDAAGLIVAKPGFDEGGDIFAVREEAAATFVTLVDVLGHGPNAATIAETAREAFLGAAGRSLEETEAAMGEAIAGSRGAAALVMELPHEGGVARAVGLGNVRGEIMTSDGDVHGIPSKPGILGAVTRRPRPSEHPWAASSILVMSTDGLKGSARVPEPRSLFFRRAALIAATRYKLRRRGSDDAGVLVVRYDP
ncbi:ATP-binding protein [Pararhizobium mangrovi]|uniref:PPM-type phosphatase domain-containing protein n=1 Tax=Pararhizobium mangrovi TaxID=2590452 RepID=A0A506U3T7_9HYPH|nr:ATP-binding protein [Pararhizobium mangrovi]TPW27961.1 hypothetical protein FJU11_10485 [Pararhizobium mangrovi]